MNYKNLEKVIFDHLSKRHAKEKGFNFSVRQKGSKGAKSDYFIGTEKSNYFGFTLWDIPVYYPGSSSDLFNFMIMIEPETGILSLKFSFYTTRSPHDFQNEVDLKLGQRLLTDFRSQTPKEFQLNDSPPENKMEYYDIRPKNNSFTSIPPLLQSLDKLIDHVVPIVDSRIAEIGEEYPEWKGGRIDRAKFQQMQNRLKRRFAKYQSEIPETPPSKERKSNSANRNEKVPLNTILFGPPGTGKTYLAKEKAVQLIDGALLSDRDDVNQRYSELYTRKQVQFVTFHQSMTYEDFVEGIKPELRIEEEGEKEEETVKYKIEDGIFKQMCVLAAYEYIKVQHSEQAATKTLTFSQLYDELINRYQQSLDEGNKILIPLKSGNSIEVTEITSRGNFKLQHQEGQRTYTVSRERSEKLYNEINDFDSIPNIYSYFRDIIGGSNASAYWAILNQIYSLDAKSIIRTEKDMTYDDKRKAFEKIKWREMDTKQDVPRYLLIIDEVNRGNIASILGELITLLEDDKRGGEDESLEAIVPYSKSQFSVPPNLYIIGTMNTADRSVEALDTALRRRFAFEEIPPDPSLLSKIEIEGIDLSRMLTIINRRIKKLLDKDHMIGHAYFLNLESAEDPLKELKFILQNKILPLLQEYFFGNFGKIQMVLGKAFVEKEPNDNFDFADSDYNGGDYQDREVFEIKNVSKMSDKQFIDAVIKIYDPTYEA